jgi:hypothetical protein
LKVQSLGVDWTLLFILHKVLGNPNPNPKFFFKKKFKKEKEKNQPKNCQSQEEIEKKI